MSVASPAAKRDLELEPGGGEQSPGARLKRRKQAAPSRAPPPPPGPGRTPPAPAPAPPPPPPPPPPQPLADLHAKMADIYKSALAFGELGLPPFDPLAAYRLLPRAHDPPRIFNPEAYCDLCCKEFCNKYFLKTHRANKHGIYDSSCDGERERSAPSSSPPQQQQQHQNRQHQSRRSSDEDSANTPRRLSPDSSRRARDAGFQPDVLRRLGVLNPEAFCEICCKEYCNKYFLKTHRERRHGAPPPTPPPELSPPRAPSPQHSTPPIPAMPVINQVKRERVDDDGDDCMSRDGQTSPLNLIVEERGAADASPGSASEELRKLQTMISQLNELAAERLVEPDHENGGNGPGPGGLRDSRPPSSSPPAPDERRSSSGSSFCEICNKELCNKYFMRTHMQRMHGISLEGGAQLGGVTCDICHKELCSKYFLRVHKHNTHGIPAPPTPAPPAAPEPCPLCARRFRGPRALRAHLLAEHAPPARPPAPLPPLPPLSSDAPLELLARDKPYACTYCPFTTDVLAFLFAHERAHAQAAEANEPEGAAGPGDGRGGEDEDTRSGGGGGGAGGEEGYSCSRCDFRAGEFGAMEAHLRAAHGGGGALLAVPRGGGGAVPVTMQPFVLEEAGGGLSLVPALVFLPVRRRATRRATVTFTLTPA